MPKKVKRAPVQRKRVKESYQTQVILHDMAIVVMFVLFFAALFAIDVGWL